MDTQDAAGGQSILGIEVRVKGYLDADWSRRFHSLAMNHTLEGDTVLVGHVRDQSELRGLLSWLADLGLELVSATAKPMRIPHE